MFPSLAEVAALFARGKEVQTALAAMVSAPEFEGLEHDDGAPTGWARVPAQPNGLELVRRRWDASGVHDVPASRWDKPGMTSTPHPRIDPWSVGPDIERLPGP